MNARDIEKLQRELKNLGGTLPWRVIDTSFLRCCRDAIDQLTADNAKQAAELVAAKEREQLCRTLIHRQQTGIDTLTVDNARLREREREADFLLSHSVYSHVEDVNKYNISIDRYYSLRRERLAAQPVPASERSCAAPKPGSDGGVA